MNNVNERVEVDRMSLASQWNDILRTYREKDPAAKGAFSILINTPELHAIFAHRIAHFLYKQKLYFLTRLISQISRFFTNKKPAEPLPPSFRAPVSNFIRRFYLHSFATCSVYVSEKLWLCK